MSEQYTGLLERVASAYQSGQKLNITAASSKSFYGGEPAGDPLSVLDQQGIIEYDPAELVIVARAGTPLAELEAELRSRGQMLGFEPPFSSRGATLGGAVASGMAGAGRPFRGGIRDFILGARIINGKAELAQFGGRVMKNVAGFDLFRPMAGAMGTLGILLEISLRVIPVPEYEISIEFASESQAKTIRRFSRFARYLPTLSACNWHNGLARMRLTGSKLAVAHDYAVLKRKYTLVESDPSHWSMVADLEDPFFKNSGQQQIIVAIDLPPATVPIDFPGEQLIDWGGARRYLKTDLSLEAVRKITETVGGYVTLLTGGDRDCSFHPPAPGLMRVHSRLKAAFDPRGILNPGRLYPDL